MKKLKVGWFSFSCSEDSTIIFTELLNDNYQKWKKLIDFKSILVMQKKEDFSEFDVAFVEGAITSKSQEEKLLKIRKNTRKLVAVGSCACMGLPSTQRNQFEANIQEEIGPFLLRLNYADKVKILREIVTVDDQVPGCPMNEKIFLDILDKYLKEFGIFDA